MGTHKVKCNKCKFEDFYIERFKHRFHGDIYHSFICYKCKKIIRLSYKNTEEMGFALTEGKCPECKGDLVSFRVFSEQSRFQGKPINKRFTQKRKLICPLCKDGVLEIVNNGVKKD